MGVNATSLFQVKMWKMLDLVSQLQQTERQLNRAKFSRIYEDYEQPDKYKWRNGDCKYCRSFFTVVKYKKESECLSCGRSGNVP